MLATDKDTSRLLRRPIQRYPVLTHSSQEEPLCTASSGEKPVTIHSIHLLGRTMNHTCTPGRLITEGMAQDYPDASNGMRKETLTAPAHRALLLIPTQTWQQAVLPWQNKARLTAHPSLLITCLLGSKGQMHHSLTCGALYCYPAT